MNDKPKDMPLLVWLAQQKRFPAKDYSRSTK